MSLFHLKTKLFFLNIFKIVELEIFHVFMFGKSYTIKLWIANTSGLKLRLFFYEII